MCVCPMEREILANDDGSLQYTVPFEKVDIQRTKQSV